MRGWRPSLAAATAERGGKLKASGALSNAELAKRDTDKAAAEKLIAKYVDSEAVVPHKLISERMLRVAKPSFVYSVSQ